MFDGITDYFGTWLIDIISSRTWNHWIFGTNIFSMKNIGTLLKDTYFAQQKDDDKKESSLSIIVLKKLFPVFKILFNSIMEFLIKINR